MSVYTSKTMGATVISNPYVGRGVVIGKTADAKKEQSHISSWAEAKIPETEFSAKKARM